VLGQREKPVIPVILAPEHLLATPVIPDSPVLKLLDPQDIRATQVLEILPATLVIPDSPEQDQRDILATPDQMD